MKLELKNNKDIDETKVIIEYAKIDRQVQGLIDFIKRDLDHIQGYHNGELYRILINDIYYVERVDRRSYIYTEKDVFESKLSLNEILDLLNTKKFHFVNRTCILNILHQPL